MKYRMPFNTPPYPDLGAKVAKLRGGNDRKAHGEAVLAAIRRLQRRELLNPLTKEARERSWRT